MKKFKKICIKTLETVLVFPFCLILGIALGVGAVIMSICGIPIYITGIVLEDIWEGVNNNELHK